MHLTFFILTQSQISKNRACFRKDTDEELYDQNTNKIKLLRKGVETLFLNYSSIYIDQSVI